MKIHKTEGQYNYCIDDNSTIIGNKLVFFLNPANEFKCVAKNKNIKKEILFTKNDQWNVIIKLVMIDETFLNRVRVSDAGVCIRGSYPSKSKLYKKGTQQKASKI